VSPAKAPADRATGNSRAKKSALPDELRLSLHRHMKRGRLLDERIEILYRQGRIPGSVYSGMGQEGTHVGVVLALGDDDVLGTTHRDLTAQLAKGLDLNKQLAQFLTKATGHTRGRDGNSHTGDWDAGTFTVLSHLPYLLPAVVGAALTFRIREQPRVAMGISGEGSTSNGVWHESVNMAATLVLPAVIVINNNQYAYSTPNARTTALDVIADRAKGYGLEGRRVDGTDVEQVYGAAKELVDKAREGGGPSVLESVSMRFRGHAGHDPQDYVDRAVLDDWKANRDPVALYEQRLAADGVLSPEEAEKLAEELKQEIKDAIAWAREQPDPDPASVTDDVYA